MAKQFQFVRSIYGNYDPDKGETKEYAKEKYQYIPDSPMNKVLAEWHDQVDDREYTVATPSSITTCPRVIYYALKKIKPTNDMGWGTKQRMLLGRAFEDKFAEQLGDKLLYHWKDNPEDAPEKFSRGSGDDLLVGVPDYLLKLDKVLISDAKTSRSDSFGYVPIKDEDVWKEWNFYKYKLQLTAYYMLAHANPEWFKKNKLPLPEGCHLFSYALDDGVVRREIEWTPTKEDMETVIKYTRRFNKALKLTEPPACTCKESFDQFDVKFCKYGTKTDKDSKVCDDCCNLDLLKLIDDFPKTEDELSEDYVPMGGA